MTPAIAQGVVDNGSGPAPADIVVTARRVVEPLQSTPIAVTAIGADTIRTQRLTSVADIGSLAPNLTLVGGRGLPSQGFVFIRGVGQSDDNPSTDPGVATYVDDVYVGRTQGSLFDLNDVAQIEVLRGPQGTLYGKNSIGGAIKVTSKLPGAHPEADAYISYGNYNAVTAGAAISEPLIDGKLAARLSGKIDRHDGFMQNLYDGKASNNLDVLSGRLVLRFTPDDALEFLLSGDVSHDSSRTQNARLVAVDQANPYIAGYLAAGQDLRPFVWRPGQSPYRGGSFDSEHDRNIGFPRQYQDVYGVSLRATYDLGASSLKSITAYRVLDSSRIIDVDASPFDLVDEVDPLHQHQFSQELQYFGATENKRFTWLAGLYYYNEYFNVRSLTDLLPVITNAAAFDRRTNQTTDSYAAFLNLGYQIVPGVRISAGGRYTKERKAYHTATLYLLQSGYLFPPTKPPHARFNDFSPKVELDYQATSTLFLYASAAKGFKSGGYNGRSDINAQLEPYRPETQWTYEVGLRSQWFDKRLTLNLTAFLSNYDDIQEQVFAPANPPADLSITSKVLNAAKARIKGVELEASARPTRGVTIFGNLGYTDAGYSAPFSNLGVDLSKNALPYVPKITGQVGTNLSTPVGADRRASLNLTYAFRSKTYFDIGNGPEIAQRAYGVLNGRLSVDLGSRLEFSLFAKNIANKVYRQNGISFLSSLGWSINYFGDPRTFGGQLRYHF